MQHLLCFVENTEEIWVDNLRWSNAGRRVEDSTLSNTHFTYYFTYYSLTSFTLAISLTPSLSLSNPYSTHCSLTSFTSAILDKQEDSLPLPPSRKHSLLSFWRHSTGGEEGSQEDVVLITLKFRTILIEYFWGSINFLMWVWICAGNTGHGACIC